MSLQRLVCNGTDCQDSECCFKQRIRLPSHGCAHCWTVEQEAAYHAKRAEQETERMERDKVADVANAERLERKRVEREAMDERMRQHLAKVGRNDQLDAANRASKRSVKRQEIHDKQRHSAQENRRMDRVDARWVESESDTVDGGLTLADFTQEVTLLEVERLPAAFTRSDGQTLLYEGRFNTVYGETAIGKSWLALMAAIERLREGRNVFWWDFEDRASTFATRLQTLNGTPFIGAPEVKWATGDLTEHPIALA